MSLKALAWAWDQDEIKSSEKFVLICLANCLNEDTGRCDPSVPYICRKTLQNKKTVYGAIASLKQKGLISTNERPGCSTQFDLNLTQNWVDPKKGTPKNGSTQIGVVSDEENTCEIPGNHTQKRVYPKTGLPKNGSTQKRVDTLPKNGPGPYPKTGHKTLSKHLRNIEGRKARESAPPDPAYQPTDNPEFSGIKNSTPPDDFHKPPGQHTFAMSFEWMPDDHVFDFLESVHGVPRALADAQRWEFANFWTEQRIETTQGKWNKKFQANVISLKNTGRLKDPDERSTRDLSIREQVTDTSWAY